MKRREREEACHICGHYHDYMGGEPCGICGHRLDQSNQCPLQPPSVLPTEVIAGFVFLGSYDHASRSDLLKTLGIEHILNTVPSCPNLYKNSFDYHTVSSSPPSLEECYNFMEKVRAEDGKVLVHCMSGTSRSPTVVIYYLMRVNGWSLAQAVAFVKQKRPSVNLKPEDMQLLQQVEAQLLSQSSAGGPSGGQFMQPFQWSPQSGGNAAPAAPAAMQGHPPSINFMAPGVPSNGFVFGGQQQQQQSPQMME